MDLRNPSHLAELIPHHEHTSLDGLSPVDILKPANDRCLARRPPSAQCVRPQLRMVAHAPCSMPPGHVSLISMCSALGR